MREIKKMSIISISVLLFSIFFRTNALAAGPLSESYFYPNVVVSTFEPYCIQYLQNAGYNENNYEYTSAYYVRRTMGNDGIFYISTHGIVDNITKLGGGMIGCYAQDGTRTTLSDIALSDPDNYSLSWQFGNDTSALKSIRLAYYSACQSGRTSVAWGNLPKKTTSLGALSSVGFMLDLDQDCSDSFDRHVFSYISRGYYLQQSLSWAVTDAESDNGGTPGGVDSYIVYYRGGTTTSPGAIYITPASYGY